MRSSWVLVSLVSHSVAITAAVIAPLVAAVDLPEVHSPLPAYVAVFAKDIQLPSPPVRRQAPTSAQVVHSGPPIEAPRGFREEPPLRQLEGPAPDVERSGPVGVIDLGIFGEIVPPPLPPAERPPVRCVSGGDVKMPRKIVDVAPVYPAIAISARKEGVVILEAVIDKQGNVKDVRVLRSIPLLDEAAIDAVRQWRYTPTLLNGQPVSVIVTVTVNFTLGR